MLSQVAIRAGIAESDGALVEGVLEFLLIGEVRRHKGQAVGFTAHGHKVGGELRFLLGDNHLHRHEYEVGDGIDVVAFAAEIHTLVLKHRRIVAGSIGILGQLASLFQRFLAIGRAA